MSKAYVERVKTFALTHLTHYRWSQLLLVSNGVGYQGRVMNPTLVNASSVNPLALTGEFLPSLPGLGQDRREMNREFIKLMRNFTCWYARHLPGAFPSKRRSQTRFSRAFPEGNFLVNRGKNTLHWPFLLQRKDEDAIDSENSSGALLLFEHCHRFGFTVIPKTMRRKERTSREQRTYIHLHQINRKPKRYKQRKTFVHFSNKRMGKVSKPDVKALILLLSLTCAPLQQLLALFAARLPP